MSSKRLKRVVSVTGLALLLAAGAVTAGSSLTWTQENPISGVGPNENLTQVIYGGGRYIAVGGAAILESADGVIWNPVFVDTGKDSRIQSVAYGNGVYVASGYSIDDLDNEQGDWLSSPDGVDWTVTNGELPTTDVVFGKGEFAVMASGWDPGSGSLHASNLFTSVDGVKWSSQDPLRDGSDFVAENLGFADGLFLMLANTDQDQVTAYASSDGVQWNATSTLPSSAQFLRIRATGDTVSAVGHTNHPVVAISEDGKAWTATELLRTGGGDFNKGSFRDIVRYGGAYLATFSNGVASFDGQLPGSKYPLAMSSDGKTWCDLLGYPAKDHGISLALNGGQIVTVGDGGSIFSTAASTSPDASLSCTGGKFGTDVSVGVASSVSVTPGAGGGGGFELPALAVLLGFASRRRGGVV